MSRERSAGGLFDDENPSQRARVRKKDRRLQCEMLRPLGPGGGPKAPSLGQVLACRADPGVDQWVPNCLRDRIEAPLLCRLVRMVEVELIHELVERHREIGGLCAGDLGDFG